MTCEHAVIFLSIESYLFIALVGFWIGVLLGRR